METRPRGQPAAPASEAPRPGARASRRPHGAGDSGAGGPAVGGRGPGMRGGDGDVPGDAGRAMGGLSSRPRRGQTGGGGAGGHGPGPAEGKGDLRGRESILRARAGRGGFSVRFSPYLTFLSRGLRMPGAERPPRAGGLAGAGPGVLRWLRSRGLASPIQTLTPQ